MLNENRKSAACFAFVVLCMVCLGCGEESITDSGKRYSEVVKSSHAIGESCSLTVNNFVGGIVIKPGPEDTIRVTTTKWADREEDLDDIDVQITEAACHVSIVTSNPSQHTNVASDLEIIVPENTRVRLLTGVGGISYEGKVRGSNSFETGVGSIRLWLPAEITVEVDLGVGVGGIHLDFTVSGQISNQRVIGTIGSGADGEITAHVGVGSIYLMRQR